MIAIMLCRCGVNVGIAVKGCAAGDQQLRCASCEEETVALSTVPPGRKGGVAAGRSPENCVVLFRFGFRPGDKIPCLEADQLGAVHQRSPGRLDFRAQQGARSLRAVLGRLCCLPASLCRRPASLCRRPASLCRRLFVPKWNAANGWRLDEAEAQRKRDGKRMFWLRRGQYGLMHLPISTRDRT